MSTVNPKTIREDSVEFNEPPPPLAGLVLVHTVSTPAWRVIELHGSGRSLVLGRGDSTGVPPDDTKISRRHAAVSYDKRSWVVEDLGSTNGTYVDGQRVVGQHRFVDPKILRIGRSIFLLTTNIRPFLRQGIQTKGETIIGPALAASRHAIERAAWAGGNLLVTGATGSGKELAARAFHDAGPHPEGPFVPVNCATIPHGLAERLLFGARKGAYSGADSDTEGYVQAADGGTLFLDEIAELELEVQAKLLRMLESREVIPLGATRPKKVDVRVVCATHSALRRHVARGKFREDLFFRLGRPEVSLPSLQERLEEIPYLVRNMLQKASKRSMELKPDASFVETCMLRRWPGNIRELATEVRQAAMEALAEHRELVTATDLTEMAGASFSVPAQALAEQLPPAPTVAPKSPQIPKDEIEQALRAEKGNVSRAAARLGIHRNKIRRWLDKHSLNRRMFTGGPEDSDSS